MRDSGVDSCTSLSGIQLSFAAGHAPDSGCWHRPGQTCYAFNKFFIYTRRRTSSFSEKSLLIDGKQREGKKREQEAPRVSKEVFEKTDSALRLVYWRTYRNRAIHRRAVTFFVDIVSFIGTPRPFLRPTSETRERI